MLRAIRQVPDRHYQVYLQESARREFKMNKEETNEDAVRMAMTRGNAQLKELQKIIRLSKVHRQMHRLEEVHKSGDRQRHLPLS
ncbi:LYR motif-containing protein 2 isoform X3 [Lethenteron reissneri]|nr:LYR motif-containing protein 2 isoform X3 [Lethenteron reissneri]